MGTRQVRQFLGSVLLLGLWSLIGAPSVCAQDEVSFLARRDFRVGVQPFSITVGDFNADGRLDLATAKTGSSAASILLNTSAPSVPVVNALVTFVPLPATFQTVLEPTGCPSGFVGTFRFRAQLTAKPTSPPLTRLAVEVPLVIC